MAGSELSSARFLPGDKTWRAAGNAQGVAAARGSLKFQDAGSPALARTAACAEHASRKEPCGVPNEDGAVQGGERAQALFPFRAGRISSYQPMLRRVPRRQEPLTSATAPRSNLPMVRQELGGSWRRFSEKQKQG